MQSYSDKPFTGGSKPTAHLHVHTCYSVMDGLGESKEFAALLPPGSSLAITDHDSMAGIVSHDKACHAAGVKPIFGVELTVHGRSHITLLAENNDGLRSLFGLMRHGVKKLDDESGIGYDLLNRYSKGVIALSGDMSSPISSAILRKDIDALRFGLRNMQDIYKDRFYLECIDWELPTQRRINDKLLGMSQKMGIPYVWTADVHYPRAQDAQIQAFLVSDRLQRSVDVQDILYHKFDGAWLKPLPDDGAQCEVAERCQAKLGYIPPQLPRVKLPGGMTAEAWLAKICHEGLARVMRREPPQAYLDRLDYELSVICSMGYASYYLIVQDFIQWAKDDGILVGPGRGSGAASIAAWSIGITLVDPIAQRLTFERFLNPDRVSMPDFDIDFPRESRQRVINYIQSKYGEASVCGISTYNDYAAKKSWGVVARLTSVSHSVADGISKKYLKNVTDLGVAIKGGHLDELFKAKNGPIWRQYMNIAARMSSGKRERSRHAAGLIITDGAITDLLPVDGFGNCQVEHSAAEKLGGVKFDLLGLMELDVASLCCGWIGMSHDELMSINTDDPSIYRLINAGHTAGTFQLGGVGFTDFLVTHLKPQCYNDICAAVALYRPGPMDMGSHIDFAMRRHGLVDWQPIHPALSSTTDDTYGILVYQEQVIEAIRAFTGWSAAKGDLVRRAMGKKLASEMAALQDDFAASSVAMGFTDSEARLVWSLVETFAGYGFNRAHSAVYAMLACITAWLKANHTAAFISASCHVRSDDLEKVGQILKDGITLGADTVWPDVQLSPAQTTPRDGRVMFGLGMIKGMSQDLAHLIELEQPFQSLRDFVVRCHPDAGSLNTLFIAGALSPLMGLTGGLMQELDLHAAFAEKAREMSQRSRRDGRSQSSLYAIAPGVTDPAYELTPTPMRGDGLFEFAFKRRQLLGTWGGSSPLDMAADYCNIFRTNTVDSVFDVPKGVPVSIIGVVVDVYLTAKQRADGSEYKYARIKIEDETGAISAMWFIQCDPDRVPVGSLVMASCEVDLWKGNQSLKVIKINQLKEVGSAIFMMKETQDAARI